MLLCTRKMNLRSRVVCVLWAAVSTKTRTAAANSRHGHQPIAASVEVFGDRMMQSTADAPGTLLSGTSETDASVQTRRCVVGVKGSESFAVELMQQIVISASGLDTVVAEVARKSTVESCIVVRTFG